MTDQLAVGNFKTVTDDYERVDKESRAEPAYVQVASILRRRIEAGRLTNWLPSRRELCQEFDVSQGTVERALGVLVGERLVASVSGRGFFVVYRSRRNEGENGEHTRS
jgi:GntR family transcriptional regulator